MQLARQPGGAEGADHDDTRRARIAATAAAPVSRPPTASTLTQAGSPPRRRPAPPRPGSAPPLGGESADEACRADAVGVARRRGSPTLVSGARPAFARLAVPGRSPSRTGGRPARSAVAARRRRGAAAATGCRCRPSRRSPPPALSPSPPLESPALGDGDGDDGGGARGRGDARCRLAVLALPGERDVAAVRDLQRADAGAGVGPGAGLPVGPPQRPVRAGRRGVDAGVARRAPPRPGTRSRAGAARRSAGTRSPGTPSRRPCRRRRRRTPAAPRRRAGGSPPPRSRRCCPSSPRRRPGPGTGAPAPRPPARARRPARIPRGMRLTRPGGRSSRCGSTGTDRRP